MLTAAQIFLCILIAIPFLGILTFLAAAGYAFYTLRRSIHIASLSHCPKCGTVVGKAPVLVAKEEFEKQMQEAHKQHPRIKYLTIAEWPICCPRCGTTFYFYPRSNTVEAHSRFAKSTT